MTEIEERYVRAASKILRDLSFDDADACTTVLNLEAQILSGDHSERPLPQLEGMVRGTINVLTEIANALHKMNETIKTED